MLLKTVILEKILRYDKTKKHQERTTNMKKFISLLLALVMALSLVACGNKTDDTQKTFAYYEIDEAAVADKLTYGSNVKEVTTAVSEGTVDCGIIYASDAYSTGLTVAVFFAGIAAAYYIAKLPRLVKGVLDVILTLPLVLPPTVYGGGLSAAAVSSISCGCRR